MALGKEPDSGSGLTDVTAQDQQAEQKKRKTDGGYQKIEESDGS
jgi:hypothetical protein